MLFFVLSHHETLKVDVLKIPKCTIQTKERPIMVRKNAKSIKFGKDGDNIELYLPIS